MFNLLPNVRKELKTAVIDSFTVNGKPVPHGRSCSGGWKRKTQEFINLLNHYNVTDIHDFTYSQVATILLHDYTHKDVTCPLCGDFKYTLTFLRMPVYCSTKCYKSCPEAKKKISDIKRDLYSDSNWKELTEAKKIATNRERLGCDHAMQNPESFEKQKKNSYQSKVYKGIKMQGYEPQAYDYLTRVFLLDIIGGSDYLKDSKQRIIWYCDEGKKHYTYPDFYVPSMNSFIEVKSDYTRQLNDFKIQKTAEVCRREGWGYYVITHRPQQEHFKFIIEPLNAI